MFKTIPFIAKQLFLDNRYAVEDTQVTLNVKYHGLLHLRHDLIHDLCAHVLNQICDYKKTIQLKDSLPILDDTIYSNLAPDIVAIQSNNIMIVDISVSLKENYEKNLKEKTDKYQPVVQYLKNTTDYEVPDFFMFWVDAGWGNIEEQFGELYRRLERFDFQYTILDPKTIQNYKHFFEDLSKELGQLRMFLPKNLWNELTQAKPEAQYLDSNFFKQYMEDKIPGWEKQKEEFQKVKEEEIEDIFERLVNDESVRNTLKDTRHSDQMYSRAFDFLEEVEGNYIQGKVKPTFFIPYCSTNDDILKYLSNYKFGNEKNILNPKKKEQRTVLDFLFFLEKVQTGNDSLDSFIRGVNTSFEKCLSKTGEMSVFESGLLTGNYEEEEKLNKSFKDFNKNKNSGMSKRTFIKQHISDTYKDIELNDTLPYIYRNKCIKLESSIFSKNEFILKSGTSYKKHHESREYKSKSTIPMDSYNEIEEFMCLLEQDEPNPEKINPIMVSGLGVDSFEANAIKSNLQDYHRVFMSNIQRTKCHSMMKHTSLAASQILHFNELNTTENAFYFFNGGRSNILHIIQGGSVCRGSDVGQSCFTIFLTDNKDWCNKSYGQIEVKTIKKYNKTFYLVITPWVRLTSERLNFMKDQYYSTLSTGYDSWSRLRDKMEFNDILRHIYVFRSCISMCPTQKIAELLMDTRYIFMSALSVCSNVEELIKDKFSPPYKNCMEQFIVRNLKKKCIQTVIFLKNNPPKPTKPGFSGKTRLLHTLGGEIQVPSLWSDTILPDLQSIFDDIFVYVHTSKEASSEYHEQIKAFNTILKYQNEFDKLDLDSQRGIHDFQSFKEFIISGKQVGCFAKFIYHGTKLFSKRYKGLHKGFELKENCLEEPIGQIVSTKSCIPEYERVVRQQEYSKQKYKKVIENMASLHKLRKEDVEPLIIKKVYKIEMDIEDDIEIVIPNTNRVKVHDALLDWIDRFGSDKMYVIDIASWNLKENKGKVLTDTCIKAQYGAKREFYVVNLGAKAMARMCENSYKVLSRHCKNEMISVPGDRKFEFIQEAINEVTLASSRRQDKIFYVNGDCTKWSSCETMASFLSMNEALRDVFGDTLTDYNAATFASWANKEIQIPKSILENLRFKSDKTSYVNDTGILFSTQNFLQGMFNYSSSLKAVIATEFSLHMFRKLHPSRKLYCIHLEHSDDYSLTVRCENIDDFMEFRLYHKLSQKLFGINDSIKKTNIQCHLLEFISLFSFNGQLLYPNIKKLKEVGTNLACNDFRSDTMAIVSRVSEATRLGISLESAYFMQRIHCCSLADAYSITPGMRNSIGDSCDIFSRPLEFFGLPDSLPLLYNCLKGNPENYRLYNFGNELVKKRLETLFVLGTLTQDELDLPIPKMDEEISEFFNPEFSYPVRNNRLKAIKYNVKLTFEEAMSYYKENVTDTILKPVELKRFKVWLRAMYFNRTFSRAYTRISRSAMSLRHSLFSSKPCIVSISCNLSKRIEDVGEGRKYLTIANFFLELDEFVQNEDYKIKEHQIKNFEKSLNCYGSTHKTFYNFLSGSSLIKIAHINHNTTVVRLPDPHAWLQLENNISTLLQYQINNENFKNDFRSFISETSLHRDISKISEVFNLELLKVSPQYCRQVFKEITSQNNNKSYGLVKRVLDKSVLGFFKQYLELSLINSQTFSLLPKRFFKVEDLYSSAPPLVLDWQHEMDNYTMLSYNLALLYRAVILRIEGCAPNYDPFKVLLNLEVKKMDVNVGHFLKTVTLKKMETLMLGERAKKIITFLKFKLLNEPDDLIDFCKSKFFFEYTYNTGHIPFPFDESITVNFMGLRFNAYLYSKSMHKKVILEMPRCNRVMWFYCYSISERLFGLISQTELDLRMVESKDFRIKVLPKELNFLLKDIAVSRLEPVFYKQHGKIIKISDSEDANIPIITQKTTFFKKLINREEIAMMSNVHITDIAVYQGAILLFKLPFGNLNYKNMLYNKQGSETLSIDNIKLTNERLDSNIIESFLKNDFTYPISHFEMESYCEEIGEKLATNDLISEVATDFHSYIEGAYIPYRQVARDLRPAKKIINLFKPESDKLTLNYVQKIDKTDIDMDDFPIDEGVEFNDIVELTSAETIKEKDISLLLNKRQKPINQVEEASREAKEQPILSSSFSMSFNNFNLSMSPSEVEQKEKIPKKPKAKKIKRVLPKFDPEDDQMLSLGSLGFGDVSSEISTPIVKIEGRTKNTEKEEKKENVGDQEDLLQVPLTFGINLGNFSAISESKPITQQGSIEREFYDSEEVLEEKASIIPKKEIQFNFSNFNISDDSEKIDLKKIKSLKQGKSEQDMFELDSEMSSLMNDFSGINALTSKDTPDNEDKYVKVFLDKKDMLLKDLSDRQKNIYFSKKEEQSADIETVRDILMSDFPENELEELLHKVDYEVPNVSESSSSSDEEGDLLPGYFQLQQNSSLYTGTYKYEQRARESLLTFENYLNKLICESDIEKICSTYRDTGLYIRTLYNCIKYSDRIRLSNKEKYAIKKSYDFFKKKVSSTSTPTLITSSKAIRYVKGKLEFFAVKSYEDISLAESKAIQRPDLRLFRQMSNSSLTNVAWVGIRLKEKHFKEFLLNKDYADDLKVSGGHFLNMLSDLIPKTDFSADAFLDEYDI